MDPIKLRHFLAVTDTRHFARAAERMGISQPAMSKSIRALETALDVRLFERGTFGVQPTPFAERLAVHARVILAEGELARAEMQALRNAENSQLGIGASISMARSLLPDALARFRRRWPGVNISVDVELSATLFDALLRGELDFVVSGPLLDVATDDALAQSYLFDEHDAVVVGIDHPLAKAPPPTLADLLNYPWVMPRRTGRLEQIRVAFAAEGLPPPPQILRTESAILARALLEREPYVCLIGRGIYVTELAAGTLCALDVPQLSATRSTFLTTRRRSTSRPAARNMMAILKTIAAERKVADRP